MLELVLVAVSVGLDNFGAATALGVSGVDARLRLRVAIIFGAFEAAMPIVGILIGHAISGDLGGKANLVAGAALVGVGVATLLQERFGSKRERGAGATLGRTIVLGAALSLDNLVVGFALGSRHVNLLVAAAVIGAVSVGLTLLGLEVGERAGRRLGERGELLGGLVLVGVGIAVAAGVLS